jgi:protoporphyrinogen/coproporphyrinogen III oxidase
VEAGGSFGRLICTSSGRTDTLPSAAVSDADDRVGILAGACGLQSLGTMKERRIAIVGGGLAGLSAAMVLVRQGASVTVFERAERTGGRALSDELDGVRIDPGAQLFGSMYERFLSLVRSIGLGDSLVRVPGRDAVWRGGRAHEVVYGSVSSMAGSGGLPFTTKMRLATSYVPFLLRHASALRVDLPELAAAGGLDGESIASWGEREVDSTFVGSLVYPQLGAYYGASPEETSAGFYHLLARHGMDVELFAVRGGVGRVPDTLVERLRARGAEIRLSRDVTGIEMDGAGVRVATEEGEERFDGVVTAIPAPDLATVLRGAPADLVEWLGHVRYRPALTLGLALDGELPVRYFGLSFPRGETRYVAAVAVQERKGVPLVPDGRGALVAFPTPEMAPTLIGAESGRILDLMMPEIERALPGLARRVTRARVYRWSTGSPVMYPGYLGRLGSFRRMCPEGRAPIAVAGDFLYGPSVEGAVSSGVDAARRLADRFQS